MSLPILKNQWGTQITPLLREKWEEDRWVMWLADLMKEIGIDPDSEDEKQEKLEYKRSLIQKEINNHSLPWLYYSGINSFMYETNNKTIDVKELNINLRIQQYIKSKSELVIRANKETSKKNFILSIPFRTYMFRKPLQFNSNKLVFKNSKTDKNSKTK